MVSCWCAAGGVGDLGWRLLVVMFVVALRAAAGTVFRVFVVVTAAVLVWTPVLLRA